jgi:hypothetical protein
LEPELEPEFDPELEPEFDPELEPELEPEFDPEVAPEFAPPVATTVPQVFNTALAQPAGIVCELISTSHTVPPARLSIEQELVTQV